MSSAEVDRLVSRFFEVREALETERVRQDAVPSDAREVSDARPLPDGFALAAALLVIAGEVAALKNVTDE